MMQRHIPANWNLEFIIYLVKKAVKPERGGLGITCITGLHLMEECFLVA